MDLKPVSLQAPSRLRKRVKEHVAQHVQQASYLLSGDVEVGITWLLHEEERYEGVHSPDIDNILKPLLDALTGPNGIIVNDCQVQSIRCSWIDWQSRDHRLKFEIRFSPDDWIPKANLLWVEICDRLCMPLITTLPPEEQMLVLNVWEKMYELRRNVVDHTGSYEAGRHIGFAQMPFHRARLGGFEVVPIQTLKRRLRHSNTDSADS